MSIEFEDVLTANLVLLGVVLLREKDQRDRFADLVNTEVISERLVNVSVPALPTITTPANISDTGLVLNLHRDRIQLVSAPSRTTVERQYPTFDDLGRLAEVAGYAIDATDLDGQAPTASGFNIGLVCRHSEEESSERYIAERLFRHERFSIENWTLVGGAGRISFEGNDVRWTVTLEPRAEDPSGRRVFLSLNLHRDTREVPNREEILGSLQEVWDRSRDFATQLDASI